MMSQQAPIHLIRISRRLKGINNPVLSTSLGRLILLFSVSVFLTFWLTTESVDATMLFQSPQSPPAQPAPDAAQPAAEQPAAQPAPVEQPPIQQAPVEQPPAQPAPDAAQPPAEQPAAEQPPAAQPPAEQPPAQQAPPAEQTVVEPAATAPTQPEPVSRRREEAPADETASGGPSNFILDQAEFIDTVIVSGAYIWLCCGVGTLLLVPLVLLFVYIRGRSKIIGEGY